MNTLFDLPFDEPAPDDEPRGPSGRRVYTVSELTAAVRALLEEGFGGLWLEGEISNCRLWNTGHLYFTLKDPGAQIRAVMFRSAVRLLRFKPEDGAHVVVRGRLAVYEPKGEYQIVCDTMEPRGLGALQAAFEQLKRRLQAEGLFDPARKRPLPALPRKIGVVTSLDGAAIRDIITVLRRRYGNAHLVVRPARVQGEGAAEDVARGVAALGRVDGVDVLIVGRGGGSIEDLWAFNEEVVARAIAACPVPVISAVGHEADYTMADFVADVRAATPSNAAEIVVARKDELAGRIGRLSDRLEAEGRRAVERRRSRLHALRARPGFTGYPGRLAMRGRRAAELDHLVALAMRRLVAGQERAWQGLRIRLEAQRLHRRLAGISARLSASQSRLRTAMTARQGRERGRLAVATGRLDAMSPLAVLARGYAVCWNRERTEVLREALPALVGQQVRVTLSRGELACEVVGTEPGTGSPSSAAPRHPAPAL